MLLSSELVNTFNTLSCESELDFNINKPKECYIQLCLSEEELVILNKLSSRTYNNKSEFIRWLVFNKYRDDIVNLSAWSTEDLTVEGLSKAEYNKKRAKRFSIRLKPFEKKALKRIAAYHQKSISSLLRWLIFQVYINDFIVIAD